jgi:hypothetical protein
VGYGEFKFMGHLPKFLSPNPLLIFRGEVGYGEFKFMGHLPKRWVTANLNSWVICLSFCRLTHPTFDFSGGEVGYGEFKFIWLDD